MTKRIQIEFTCDNAAFDGLNANEAIAEVLNPLLDRCKVMGLPGYIFDRNGNKIGQVSTEWDESDD